MNSFQEKNPQPMVAEVAHYPNHQGTMSPPPPFSAQTPQVPQPPQQVYGYDQHQPQMAYAQPAQPQQSAQPQQPQQPHMAYTQQGPGQGQPMMQTGQGQPMMHTGQGQPMMHTGQSQQFQRATAIPNLGMGPAPVDCPNCGQRCMTNISYQAGNTTHVWAGITFLFTWCLCFIPYMLNSLKDVQHRCGNCGTLLATWHKSGQVETHMHA